jgi:WD40 repeat protein
MKNLLSMFCAILIIFQIFSNRTSAMEIDSTPVRQFGYGTLTSNAAVSPDGKFFLTGSYDGRVRLWDVETGALVRTFSGHKAMISSVAFSPDGKLILTGAHENGISVFGTIAVY